MSIRLALKLFLALGLVGCADAAATSSDVELESIDQSLQTTEIDFPVVVRTVGSASVHAHVYVNDKTKSGETLLAVHGLTETGSNYERLSTALFADRKIGKRIKRVVAISMIGHGESGYPEGLPNGMFGQLTIDDNVSVLIQSIYALRNLGLAPQTIIGHSMGGLALQAAQEALLAQGSSYAQLGINKAALIASVPPRDRPWTRYPSGDPTPFFVSDPVLGTYLALPPEAWLGQGFRTFAGTLVAGTPSVEEVVAKGYVGYEPAVTLAQLTGTPIPLPTGGSIIIPRPAVRAGAFAPANGTLLGVVSFSQDSLTPQVDQADLYTYLTGDSSLALYAPVVGPEAVHNMFIANPTGMLGAIRSLLCDH